MCWLNAVPILNCDGLLFQSQPASPFGAKTNPPSSPSFLQNRTRQLDQGPRNRWYRRHLIKSNCWKRDITDTDDRSLQLLALKLNSSDNISFFAQIYELCSIVERLTLTLAFKVKAVNRNVDYLIEMLKGHTLVGP